jgi:hypothetical protein
VGLLAEQAHSSLRILNHLVSKDLSSHVHLYVVRDIIYIPSF